MTIRHMCAAIVTVAASLAFFVQPAVAQRETGACVAACDRTPASEAQKQCCETRCFCDHPPDYMSPHDRAVACEDVKTLCR